MFGPMFDFFKPKKTESWKRKKKSSGGRHGTIVRSSHIASRRYQNLVSDHRTRT